MKEKYRNWGFKIGEGVCLKGVYFEELTVILYIRNFTAFIWNMEFSM